MSAEKPGNHPERSERSADHETAHPLGRAILARLRHALRSEDTKFSAAEDEDLCESLYLTERDSCVPEHLLGEDLMDDIISAFYHLFDAVRDELGERLRPAEQLSVYVQPDYQDASHVLLVTPTRVLLVDALKAWNLWWQTEDEMAEGLEGWYRRAEAALRAP